MVPAADDVSARLHSRREDEQDTKRGPFHCLVQIRIVEDDVGALSTQFQGHVLQVALGRSIQDLATDECRTSEGDLFDLQVMRDGIADSVTVAIENVDDAGRETGLVDEVGYADCSQGGELRGLENNCVSRCQGGTKFPGQHEHWAGQCQLMTLRQSALRTREVPGYDLTDDTDRLVASVGELSFACL